MDWNKIILALIALLAVGLVVTIRIRIKKIKQKSSGDDSPNIVGSHNIVKK